MALVVPNPTVPANGQALDATPLLANLNAVYQAIQSFDGSQIQAGSIIAAAMNAAINPNTLLKETEGPFIFSGLIWSTVSGLAGTMTAGTAYVASSTSMLRVLVLSVASNTFAASKDVYIDVDVNGNITYTAVTNGAASPAVTANSVRIAKVVTAAASITSFQQSGYDSLFNPIYPTSPAQTPKLNIQSFTNSGTAGGTFYYTNLGSLKLIWGVSANQASSVGGTIYTLVYPTGFIATLHTVLFSVYSQLTFGNQYAAANNIPTTSSLDYKAISPSGAASQQTAILVIGQ
jgi:hypothetical protein